MQPVSLRSKCRRKLSGRPFHSNPIVDTVMRRRGVYSASKMEYKLKNLLSFKSLKGIEEAQRIIVGAIMQQKKILVLADYDCDGATACTVMVKGLRMLGAKNVSYAVPNRFTMGYGTTPALVDSIASQEPDLIITVDNGISSFAGIDHIRKVLPKTQIVVTDHHIASSDGSLPDADAVVNPNQIGCDFPSKNLCGCGVAWYVCLAVRALMREMGAFFMLGMKEPNLAILVDIVALGTIADVVPLDYNNRIIVSVGLDLVRSEEGNRGIVALLRASGKNVQETLSSDFSFGLGPRINSAGRLADMRLGIETLLSDKETLVNGYANELCKTNDVRKDIQNDMIAVANIIVKKLDNSRRSIVLHHESFNEGIVGLVASRLKESYGVPTFIFAKNDNGMLKGSGRSVPGAHLYNILHEVQELYTSRNNIFEEKDKLIQGFGGHAMAAGLSILPENLEVFYNLLDEIVKEHLEKPLDIIETDGEINPEDYTLENVEELRMSSPFGQSFPEPILEMKLQILSTRFSKNKRHLFYVLQHGSKTYEAIAFNYEERKQLYKLPKEGEESNVRVVFRPDISMFSGKPELKMIVESAI